MLLGIIAGLLGSELATYVLPPTLDRFIPDKKLSDLVYAGIGGGLAWLSQKYLNEPYKTPITILGLSMLVQGLVAAIKLFIGPGPVFTPPPTPTPTAPPPAVKPPPTTITTEVSAPPPE